MVFFMVCADNHHKKEIDFNSLLRYFDFHRLRQRKGSRFGGLFCCLDFGDRCDNP